MLHADFYHAGLVLIYISGTGRYLPSILCELASRENIHALIRYRYTNYMLIVFMYFIAMRFALPNPTSAFFWFGVFIYVRAILASKIISEEMLLEELTGDKNTHVDFLNPRVDLIAVIMPAAALSYFSYALVRQIQIEFQLWRIGHLKIQLLKVR